MRLLLKYLRPHYPLIALALVLAGVLLVQTAVAALLALATAQGALGRGGVLALSMVLGAARAFQMPASQALLPLLVDLRMLPRALALSSVALQGAIIAGPALGGALYAAGGWLDAHRSAAGTAAATGPAAGGCDGPCDRPAGRADASTHFGLGGLRCVSGPWW